VNRRAPELSQQKGTFTLSQALLHAVTGCAMHRVALHNLHI
jgi:hypothetical protein